jgi:beta-lactam-binding protein with PASTA domain
VTGATVHLTGPGSCTITASQAGNANYAAAADVSRTFRIARAPCTVPNVVGKRLAAAKQSVARSHCRTGKVGHARSRGSRKGVVVSQSRRPGRVLPAGSKIDLVVGRGRRR